MTRTQSLRFIAAAFIVGLMVALAVHGVGRTEAKPTPAQTHQIPTTYNSCLGRACTWVA
jgi:hypothetical protein